MRLRKNPELARKVQEYQDIVYLNSKIDEDLTQYKPIELELGCGKGRFLTGMAQLHKDKFFIGAETQIDIIYYAALKARASECKNLRFIHGDVNHIETWFSDVKVDCIYINFCDPWPKKRHAKRRLVARNFLRKYMQLVAKGASLRFKTDNKALFEFALEEFAFCGLTVVEQTNDLHNSQIENLVWTEYEKKFHKLGMPINFCHVVF